MKKYSHLIFVLIIFCGINCSHQKKNNQVWNPKTARLDHLALEDTNFISLDQDVKEFYNLLQKKDWKATYDRRWLTFRQDFPEELYLKISEKYGAVWGLSSYEILSVETDDLDNATIICKFIEFPDSAVVYTTVRWHKEDGIWKCDAAGPCKLTIFRYTRIDKQN